MSAHDYLPAPAADFVLPFSMPERGIRGRIVRLDSVSDRALSAHELPECGGRALSEGLALTAMLGSSVKLDGRLTVQIKGSGPLELLTVDYYGAALGQGYAGLRGYARIDQAKVALIGNDERAFADIVGEGILAITIEPRIADKSYQGIVPLSSTSIGATAELYFLQSEQLPTRIKLAAAPAYVPGNKKASWRAGGIMLQVVPDKMHDEDDWNRLSMFLNTVEDIELLDTSLPPERLLWRLFHEDAIRVHAPEFLCFNCSCDTSRIKQVLEAYPHSDRLELADTDGIIRARCEFCGKEHAIRPDASVPE